MLKIVISLRKRIFLQSDETANGCNTGSIQLTLGVIPAAKALSEHGKQGLEPDQLVG